MSHLKEQNQRLFAEMERLQLEIMALNRDKKTMGDQLETANGMIRKKEEVIEKMGEELEKANSENEKLKLEIETLNDSVKNSEKMMKRKEEENKKLTDQLEKAHAEIEKLKLENSKEFKKKAEKTDIKKAIVGNWKRIDSLWQWWFKVEGNKFMERRNDWEEYDVYTFGVKHRNGVTVTVEGDRIVRRWNDARYEFYMENDYLIEDWYQINQLTFKHRYARIGSPS